MPDLILPACAVRVGDRLYNKFATWLPADQRWIEVRVVEDDGHGHTRLVTDDWETMKHPDEGVYVRRKENPVSQKIFVAYRLKPVAYLDALLPPNPVPTGDQKVDDKALKDHEKLVDNIKANATDMVYTATFDQVLISVPPAKGTKETRGESPDFDSNRPAKKGEQSTAVRTRNWLLKHFPTAWPADVHPPHGPVEAYFVGFEPRMFLKVLGTECAIQGNPLPASMWYGNSDHRDLREMVLPKTESKYLDWPQFFAALRQHLQEKDREEYDKLVAGWNGPGVDLEKDMQILMLLALHFGI